MHAPTTTTIKSARAVSRIKPVNPVRLAKPVNPVRPAKLAKKPVNPASVNYCSHLYR